MKVFELPELNAALLGAGDDRSGKRMLTAALKRRGEKQQLSLGDAGGGHD